MAHQVTDAQILRFARAAVGLLAVSRPELEPRGLFQPLASSVGRRNYLFEVLLACGPAILKIRSHRALDIDQEASALAEIGGESGPALLGTLHVDELRAQAMGAKDLASISALDLPVGDGLLMGRLQGRFLCSPVSVQNIEEIARGVALLHAKKVKDVPPMRVPPRPSVMIRVIEDHIEEVRARALVTEETLKDLRRALRALKKHPALVKGEWPKIRKLCHGDLRWHNFLVEGVRIELIDFEDAGEGDPVVDLAMMVCRTPLSWFEELCLLETYDEWSEDKGWLSRYFHVLPFVGLMCGLAALLELADVAQGLWSTIGDVQAHVLERTPALAQELYAALSRILGPAEECAFPVLSFGRVQGQPGVALRISVDGTSASLKSPFCYWLAHHLGLPYYNTGAVYRYVALWCLCRGLRPEKKRDRSILLAHLEDVEIELLDGGAVRVGEGYFDGSLGSPEVEGCVAQWAAIRDVRERLAPIFSRALAEPGVFEGRDVGTVMLADADVKIFIDASEVTRAKLLSERAGIGIAAAKKLLSVRDGLDRSREVSPLQIPEGAIELKPQPRTLMRLAEKTAIQIRKGGEV